VSPDGARRALHVASAVVVLPVLHSITAFRLVALWGATLAASVELLRLSSPRVGRWLAARVPVYRPGETQRPSGAMWLAFGYALAAWVALPAAVAGILAGALADPAAAWCGQRWGRGAGKSWIGSGAVLVVTAGVTMAVGVAPLTAVLAGLVASALERWSGPVNDNLLIAPGVAVFVALLA
jgi:dolichol kinase